jgi:hypothetical protein
MNPIVHLLESLLGVFDNNNNNKGVCSLIIAPFYGVATPP